MYFFTYIPSFFIIYVRPVAVTTKRLALIKQCPPIFKYCWFLRQRNPPHNSKMQNNTTQKKPKEKKENPAHQRNFVRKVVFLVHNSKHKLTAGCFVVPLGFGPQLMT